MQRIAVVGSGHLAHALWEGWHRNPPHPRQFSLIVRSEAHRNLWTDLEWAQASSEMDNLSDAQVVVLAVKPKDMKHALEQVVPRLGAEAMLVSPVAGWTIAQLRRAGVSGPIARIMPNVCAAIGASTTLVSFDGVDHSMRFGLEEFLAECGSVTVVAEAMIDPFTALIGSGPAYVFLLLEALIASGQQMGVDAHRSRELVSSMVEGAAKMAKDRSGDSLQDWIGQVASPGGTTEALLQVLNQSGWPGVLQEAVVAAGKRAAELGSAS